MTTFEDVHRVLDATVDAQAFRSLDDPNGTWRTGAGEVGAIGLLLDPWVGMETWVAEERIDLLVVHRPWGLPDHLPGDPGILAYHLAFDERLTVGFNPLLAAVLGMSGLEPLGLKSGRPIGMIGDIGRTAASEFTRLIASTFGVDPAGVDPVAGHVDRVAIAGASWPSLISEAAEREADLFVTGVVRAPARAAVMEIGLPVFAVGHRPSEIWGLRALAGVLGAAFPDLEVHVCTSETHADSRIGT